MERDWPDDARAEVARLRAKIGNQAANIDEMRKALERKNRQLDALHLVWCDGACPGGVHRWNPDLIVTEELVEIAERNARRLRSWYNGVRFRLGLKQRTADDWLRRYALRAAAKTDLATQEVPGER